ncbi:ATP-binding protein [Pandoraea sp. PE-S2T-3]|uniref:ATP-binding protein n=1 Tax=Pandoraea sp. PE-S2T-3 TaxID=1986993 RepID=UPI000B3FCCDF|nr:ATP-binding protein [Pandoraea sp. PE-S2T-3]
MIDIAALQRRNRLGYLIPLWIAGCAALCGIAWLCLTLQLRLATTGFSMLLVVVLLSYFDSFVSSVIFSVTSALLLNIFFTPPVFSLRIDKAVDYIPLAAFLLCSLLVTSLVRRIRDAERTQREHARLLDLTHDTIFVRDANDIVTYWNHAAEMLYGWRRHEAIGRRSHDLLQTEFPAPLAAIEAAYLRDGEWEGELVHTKRDGSRVTVASRWAMQRDANGEPLGTLETNNNVTRRKQAEARLHQIQAQYLEEAQRLSKTGSFGWHLDTGALFWSPQAYEIFEASPDVAPSLAFVRERIHPDDLPMFEAMLADVTAQGSRFDLEHRIVLPGGRIRYLHVVAREATAQTITQADGRQFIGAVMDVTDARQTAARLRQAQTELARASRITALGELSASIAHEVGQPLAAITTNGEACLRWLHRTPPNYGEVEGCVVQMTEEGNRAAEIVQRVRRLMKGAAPEVQAVDVNRLIHESVAMIRNDIDANGVQPELCLSATMPRVSGDPIQLQQVLINLMLNAVQAMATQEGPRYLRLASVCLPDGRVRVSVSDSGPGIAAVDIPLIFDAFFTTKATGMGMGLAICQSIVEAHGGTIEAINNATARDAGMNIKDGATGATFAFRLAALPTA